MVDRRGFVSMIRLIYIAQKKVLRLPVPAHVAVSMKTRLKLGFAAFYLLAALPASAHKLQDGVAAYTHGNFDKALSLLKPLASRGDAYAEMTLGLIYAKGQGVKQDYAEAANWYGKGCGKGQCFRADQSRPVLRAGPRRDAGLCRSGEMVPQSGRSGSTFAAGSLASLYANGQGVKQDYADAARWYRKAADKGDVAAEVNLASLYLRGAGVSKSDHEASIWLRKGAEEGTVYAQAMLAYLLSEGRGVKQDYAEAAEWYRKAANQGDVGAQTRLADLLANGTASQR